jgi:hypothetical protein
MLFNNRSLGSFMTMLPFCRLQPFPLPTISTILLHPTRLLNNTVCNYRNSPVHSAPCSLLFPQQLRTSKLCSATAPTDFFSASICVLRVSTFERISQVVLLPIHKSLQQMLSRLEERLRIEKGQSLIRTGIIATNCTDA